jgi:hypothetical protein
MNLTKYIIFLLIVNGSQNFVIAQDNCLFKNPLCFYNTDILTYLQVLHKNQQYETMSHFFFGPYQHNLSRQEFIKSLSEADIGYSLKRAGIKSISKGRWAITYQRTIMGTNETFKIQCAIEKDTCRVFLDKRTWETIFR